MKKRLLWLAFGCYCLLMLWLLFGQRLGKAGAAGFNLQPFGTLRRYIWVLRHSQSQAQLRHAVVNLVGNVVMFVPLGLLLPALWQRLRRFWIFLLWLTAIILAVELLQLLSGLGSCDVDDLLLNVCGGSLGFFCRKITK